MEPLEFRRWLHRIRGDDRQRVLWRVVEQYNHSVLEFVVARKIKVVVLPIRVSRFIGLVEALGLKGTLISNAASRIPHPGLFEFLKPCRELDPRIVMFTTVTGSRFRATAELLA